MREYAPPQPSQPSIPVEAMTQPMGPLERGDQAIVDVVANIPAGEHRVTQDGVNTRVLKTEMPGRDMLSTQTLYPDGTWEETGADIGKATGARISADIADQPTVLGGEYNTYTNGNNVGESVIPASADGESTESITPAVADRKNAQRDKVEIARRIEAASKRLGDMSVEGASKQE